MPYALTCSSLLKAVDVLIVDPLVVQVYSNSVVRGAGLHRQSIDSDAVDDFASRVTYVWPLSLKIPRVSLVAMSHLFCEMFYNFELTLGSTLLRSQ